MEQEFGEFEPNLSNITDNNDVDDNNNDDNNNNNNNDNFYFSMLATKLVRRL